MTGSTEREHAPGEIREEYDEYDVGESSIGVISDPVNEHAWIWSDTVATPTP
ncbi:hypothetical protein [Salinarchaeum laminariae]|uniref:hypothetical protein n=1 Tax=Salinarchaeum laminariae TaxID=869888 RepID=UPI0020BD7D96|nr:hypothetical protein [Salinarchaeum laminariae]